MLPAEDTRVRNTAPPPPPPPPPPERNQITHPVQPGETLEEISARYQVPRQDLMQANPQIASPDAIAANRNLVVPLADGAALPAQTKVESGQSLDDIAKQYSVDPQKLREANGLGANETVYPGDPLWIPGAGPSVGGGAQAPASLAAQAPLTPQAQRVDDALTRYESAVDAQATMHNAPPPAPQQLQGWVDSAKNALSTAIDAELQSRAQSSGITPDAATLKTWGEDIAARYAGSPSRQTQIASTVADIGTDRDARAVIASAQAQSDPAKALQALNDGYTKATPEVQQKIDASADRNAIIDQAVEWANQPLKQNDTDFPQAQSLQAIQRLDQLTSGLDKNLAADVVTRALPGYESFNKDYQQNYGSSMFAQQGIVTLMKVSDRIAGTPAGDAAVARFVDTGAIDRNGVLQAMSEGIGPAYVVAFIKANGDKVDVDAVLETVQSGMQIYQSKVADDVKAYAKETEELHWLIANHGGAMTPQQLQSAIDDYRTQKGPEWADKVRDLENTLAADGQALLHQAAQLQQLPATNLSQAQDIATQLLTTPEAQAAVAMAFQKHPEITAGSDGLALKDFFASAKTSNELRKLGGQFVNAYVKNEVYGRVSELDPNKPATVTAAGNALEELRDSKLARILGVSDSDLGKAIDQIKSTLPAAGESVDSIAAKLNTLDKTLSGMKGFSAGETAGRMFRLLGVAGSGSSFLNSGNRTLNDPSVLNGIKLFADSASLARSGGEIVTALTQAPETSIAGRLASAGAGKLVGVLGAVGDTALAVDSALNGDPTAAALYGTTAVGGGLVAAAAFGAAAWTGPVGIGLIIVGTVGNAIWGHVKESNKHDNQTSADFLAHAGLSADKAKALVDQSGDGYSTVPLLMKYGQMKGLTPQQTVAWINGIDNDRLGALRDNLHRTLDEFDGDAGKFNATASDDRWVVQDTQQRPWFAVSGAARPESAAQLDAVLAALQIAVPHA